MELTTNTFTSGLQMDTHPMLQGQDTLTDALNATFVTMNGNEVVLQNDMGNASVQNAYLPQGYMPVGMKEYGGVIYVAAYNPILDRGQIGSFPSPLRRFFDATDTNADENENYGCKFDPENFLSKDRKNIEKRTLLLPLTTKNTLFRAGDKFVLYFSNANDTLLPYLSNRNNILSGKIKSPKNNYFTLSLGVMNSRNEFVDITKDLLRFDTDNKPIQFEETASEEYKFNSGYFICNSLSNNSKIETVTTQNDSNLKKVRALDKLDLNTYGYKLVGEPYIKALLNLPVDFDYSFTGWNDKNNSKVQITIKGVISYNCPDGITDSNDDGDNIYYKYYDNVQPTKFGLDVTGNLLPDFIEETIFHDNSDISLEYWITDEITVDHNLKLVIDTSNKNDYTIFEKNGNQYNDTRDTEILCQDSGKVVRLGLKEGHGSSTPEQNVVKYYICDIDDNPITKITLSLTKYDPVTNLYSFTFEKVINFNYSTNSIFYGILTPTIIGWNEEELKISDLARDITIDFSLLNSGEMKLTDWRFYNDTTEKKTAITYGFQSYPKEGQEFKNLKFDIYDATFANDSSSNEDNYLNSCTWIKSYSPNIEIGLNGVFDDVIEWEDVDTPQYLFTDNKYYKISDDDSSDDSSDDNVTVYSNSTSTEYQFGNNILTEPIFGNVYIYVDDNETATNVDTNGSFKLTDNIKGTISSTLIHHTKNIQLFNDSSDSSSDSSDSSIGTDFIKFFHYIYNNKQCVRFYINKFEIPKDSFEDNYRLIEQNVLYFDETSIPLQVNLKDCLKYSNNDIDVIYYNKLKNIYFKKININNIKYKLLEQTPELTKYEIKPNRVYQVKISWDSIENGESTKIYDLRWILTTRLFNDSYWQSNKTYIKDFCNPKSELEEYTYKKLTTITPKLIVDGSTEVVKIEEYLDDSDSDSDDRINSDNISSRTPLSDQSLIPNIEYTYKQTYNIICDCGKAGLPIEPFLKIIYPTIYTNNKNNLKKKANNIFDDHYNIIYTDYKTEKYKDYITIFPKDGGKLYNYKLKPISSVMEYIPYMSLGIALNNEPGHRTKFYVNLYNSENSNIELLHDRNGKKSTKNYMNRYTDYTYVKGREKMELFYWGPTNHDDPRTVNFSLMKGELFSKFNSANSNGLILGKFSFGRLGANVKPLNWINLDGTDSWIACKSIHSLNEILNKLNVPVEDSATNSNWYYYNTIHEDIYYEIEFSDTINIYKK